MSVVLPIYNEKGNLEPLLRELSAVLGDVPHEIIAVDDGSTDGSLDELKSLVPEVSGLRILVLQRRCGQSAAMMAGIDVAAGEILVTMDADGQNDPADIPVLLGALGGEPSYAAAVGYRVRRADGVWRRVQSRFANAVRNRITGDTVRDTGCGLRAIRRGAALGLVRFDGMHRFIPTLLRMRGWTVVELPVKHRMRLHGRSKYGAWNRAFRGLWDAMGVRWLARRSVGYEVKEMI